MTADELYPDADWLRISPLTGRTGLRLTGEADEHTAEILRKAMAELPPDAPEIHLQLASLEFIDVAAARHLAALAERPVAPKVILYCPPASLIFLMRLLWPDALDRFWICGERTVTNPNGPAAHQVPARKLPNSGDTLKMRLHLPAESHQPRKPYRSGTNPRFLSSHRCPPDRFEPAPRGTV